MEKKYEIIEVIPHQMVFTEQLLYDDGVIEDQWEGGSVIESTGLEFDSYKEAQEKSKELWKIANNAYLDFLILVKQPSINWEENFREHWGKYKNNYDSEEQNHTTEKLDQDVFKSPGMAAIYSAAEHLYWNKVVSKEELKAIKEFCKK